MKYVSNKGTLYAMPEKKWASVCVIAVQEGKPVAQVIDERFILKPMGEVTNVTNWTAEDAARELQLLQISRWSV